MRKLKILLKIIALEIKKFFIVLDQKNIERIVKKLNRKCDYKLGFGIEYCRNYRNIDCDIFVRKNKKYVFMRQIYQKNCYANPCNDKLIRENDYKFSLYKLFDVDKSIGDYVCENQNDVSVDNISYHLWMKKIPFIGINDKIKEEFLGSPISIDFSRGVTGKIVVKTDIGMLRVFVKDSVLNTHELTKIEAEEFMKELNRFVRNVNVVNYNEFKRDPWGLVDNDEDYIESIPTSYTDVRQINKEINELKGRKNDAQQQ